MNDLGWGIGHLEPQTDEKLPEDPQDWKVRVPLVLPGELVRVRVFKNFDTYSEADLVQVLEPSDDRVEPKCGLAGKCAGCQFQHMKIETQRQWKMDYVKRGLLEQKIAGYTTEEFEEWLQFLEQGSSFSSASSYFTGGVPLSSARKWNEHKEKEKSVEYRGDFQHLWQNPRISVEDAKQLAEIQKTNPMFKLKDWVKAGFSITDTLAWGKDGVGNPETAFDLMDEGEPRQADHAEQHAEVSQRDVAA